MSRRVLWLWPSWRSFFADATATACLPVLFFLALIYGAAFGA